MQKIIIPPILLFAIPWLFMITLSDSQPTSAWSYVFSFATLIVPIGIAIWLRDNWFEEEKPTFRLLLFLAVTFAGIWQNCQSLDANEVTFVPNLLVNFLFYGGIIVGLWWLFERIIRPGVLPADWTWGAFFAGTWKKTEPVAFKVGNWLVGAIFLFIVLVLWAVIGLTPIIASWILGVAFLVVVLVLWPIVAIWRKAKRQE